MNDMKFEDMAVLLGKIFTHVKIQDSGGYRSISAYEIFWDKELYYGQSFGIEIDFYDGYWRVCGSVPVRTRDPQKLLNVATTIRDAMEYD